MLRRTASWSLGLLAFAALQGAEAHEPPVVTGMVAGPDDAVVLRTTRGLVVGDLRGGPFSLQCLELSEFLPAETPSLTFFGSTLFVSGVEGLVSMTAKGCGLERPAQFTGVPMTDVHQRPDGSLVLLTTGAGMVNDGWTSRDGVTWEQRGLALEQALYSSLRPFGAREVATGELSPKPGGTWTDMGCGSGGGGGGFMPGYIIAVPGKLGSVLYCGSIHGCGGAAKG